MLTKIKKYWNKLPHELQAAAVIFTTAAGTTLAKELQALIFSSGAFTWLSLKHDIAAALVAGALAARAFYMLPSSKSLVVASTPPVKS